MENTPYYDPRVVIYEHKMFIRLATDLVPIEKMNPILFVQADSLDKFAQSELLNET